MSAGPADPASPERTEDAVGGPADTFTPLHRALTARGAMVLGGALIVLIGGLLLSYAELIGLGLAGLAAVLGSLVLVGRAPRVTVEREIDPPRVTRGSQRRPVARVTVRAATRRAVPAMSALDVAGPGTIPVSIPRLKGEVSCVAQARLPVDRRGLVPSGPLLVARDDPFGLAHRTLNTGVSAVLYVRPKAIPLPDVTASLARSVDGPQSDMSTEGTLAFDSLRDYVPGDELRHVHWRASAHADKLVVKRHVDMTRAAVTVILDTAAGPDPDDLYGAAAEAFDVAVDCAASVAVIASQQRHPLLLVDGAGQSLLPPAKRGRGSIAAEDVLDALTTITARTPPAGPVDPLGDTVRRLGNGARGSLAAVVSTRSLANLAEPLRLLAGAYARVLAVQAGGTMGRTARTGRVVWVTVGSVDELPVALLRARTAA
jgi:uncharacterized protein (DUF58 family)